MLRATLIAAIAWLAVAVPAQAETVAVQSGEHGDFTRLVLDFALPTTWQMVRTPEGYAVTVDRPGLEFDLSSVYRVITQDRLSTIWTDPATGALTLGIGCACHAFPFEMASDVLVIDLRDGPAPPASSFEYAADGELMPPLTPRAAKRPKTRPMPPVAETRQETVPSLADGPVYDWIAAAGAAAKPVPVATPAVTTPEVPASEPAPHLDQAALQDALLRQISNGAARGTVEIAPAMRNHAAATEPAMTDTPAGHDPMVQIAVDGAGWVDPDATDREADRMTATGATCIPDSAVDVAAWGDARPVAVAMGSRTGAIYGEFDKPNPEAAETAIKYLLHLSFGFEAQVMIRTLEVEREKARIWSSLATILDGGVDPDGPFAGMEVCDGTVALWSVLAKPELAAGARPQIGAILRSFSALPIHLRRYLGPALADRFLARGDTGTVRAIRNAILRPGGNPGPAVRLLEAELQQADGLGTDTRALADLQSAKGTTAVTATIALIEAIISQGGTVDAALLTATEAMIREHKGTPEETALRRVLALGKATQGQIGEALGLLKDATDEDRDTVWAVLAKSGSDSAVLTYAVVESPEAVPNVPAETVRAMARRLLDLGFPDPALDWLATLHAAQGGPSQEDRLLSAEAQLHRRNAMEALRQLADMEGEPAATLRQQAEVQLGAGDVSGASPEGLSAGPTAPATGTITEVGKAGQDSADIWQRAAGLVADKPTALPEGSLAQAKELIKESAAARDTMRALLEQAGNPAPGESVKPGS